MLIPLDNIEAKNAWMKFPKTSQIKFKKEIEADS